MSEILNVISISAAPGWFFGEITDDIATCEPVACFALIEFCGSNGLERTIIPIDQFTVSNEHSFLMGHDLAAFRKPIIHKSEFSSD